jgi:hypothetical protein
MDSHSLSKVLVKGTMPARKYGQLLAPLSLICYGAYFWAIITGTTISFVGYAFVDDTDLCITSQNPHDSEANVAPRMQQALDLLEGNIRATGGATVPEKSRCYLIDLKWRYVTKIEAPAQLRVRDCDGNVAALERSSVSDARRTLGIKLPPDGNNQAQFQKLLDAAKTSQEQIRGGRASPTESRLGVDHYNDFKYSTLPVTRNDSDSHKVRCHCSGIARTLPRALVYGPVEYQGLGISNFCTPVKAFHILSGFWNSATSTRT